MKQPSVHAQRVCDCGIQVNKKKAMSDDKIRKTFKKIRQKTMMFDDKTLARFGHATVSDWFKGKAHWELSEFYFQ